ncbi:MAG: dihydrodipicolinate synthase family protein [Gemmatimonas sp.]|nr:dihydrodipicolinate synthase family protein [Gemmatimonas sp.]
MLFSADPDAGRLVSVRQSNQICEGGADLSPYTGVFAPTTTPFDPATGDLDLESLRNNARHLVATDLAGLVLFGSTGEGVLLDDDERVAGLEAVREIAEGKLMLAGVGAESTRATVRLVRRAAEAGADAALVPPPAYYRPQLTVEALWGHYSAVADTSSVPVLLYQIPPVYSGVELGVGLVAELSRHPNIHGIKDSTGDLEAMQSIREACAGDFAVLVGSGAVVHGALEVGACGAILAIANLAPDECAEILAAGMAGDPRRGEILQARLAPLHRAVVGRYGVPGVKTALDLIGLVGGPPRPPLLPLPAGDRDEVRAALEAAGLFAGQ